MVGQTRSQMVDTEKECSTNGCRVVAFYKARKDDPRTDVLCGLCAFSLLSKLKNDLGAVKAENEKLKSELNERQLPNKSFADLFKRQSGGPVTLASVARATKKEAEQQVERKQTHRSERI